MAALRDVILVVGLLDVCVYHDHFTFNVDFHLRMCNGHVQVMNW